MDCAGARLVAAPKIMIIAIRIKMLSCLPSSVSIEPPAVGCTIAIVYLPLSFMSALVGSGRLRHESLMYKVMTICRSTYRSARI